MERAWKIMGAVHGGAFLVLLVLFLLQVHGERYTNVFNPKRPVDKRYIPLGRRVCNLRWAYRRAAVLACLLGAIRGVDPYAAFGLYPPELASVMNINVAAIVIAIINLSSYVSIRLSYAAVASAHNPAVRHAKIIYAILSLVVFLAGNISIAVRWSGLNQSRFWTSSLFWGINGMSLLAGVAVWDYNIYRLSKYVDDLETSGMRPPPAPKKQAVSDNESTGTHTRRVVVRYKRFMVFVNIFVLLSSPFVLAVAVRRGLDDSPYEYPNVEEDSVLSPDLVIISMEILGAVCVLWYSWVPVRCSPAVVQEPTLDSPHRTSTKFSDLTDSQKQARMFGKGSVTSSTECVPLTPAHANGHDSPA